MAARLLLIVSHDYGELSNARYLLAGRDFDAAVLVPERLHAAGTGLPARVSCYRSLDDVTDVLARERPQVVVLFSAYLFALGGLLNIRAVRQLVDAARRAGAVVVTSDPFLGLLRTAGPSPFSPRHPRQAWLTEHFAATATVLDDVWHVYLSDPAGLPGDRKVSFFNDRLLMLESERAALRVLLAGRLPIQADRNRWLFVLSAEDDAGQVSRHGRAPFAATLHKLLRAATRRGRQPVLVAPPDCVAAVAEQGKPDNLLALPYCAPDLFAGLLADAEHAFYWNVFANSIGPRLWNGQSVFFFDRGHLAGAVPSLFRAGVQHYFAGAEPTYLDPAVEPDAERLRELAAQQASALAPARQRAVACPAPEDMVAFLLNPPSDRS